MVHVVKHGPWTVSSRIFTAVTILGMLSCSTANSLTVEKMTN